MGNIKITESQLRDQLNSSMAEGRSLVLETILKLIEVEIKHSSGHECKILREFRQTYLDFFKSELK